VTVHRVARIGVETDDGRVIESLTLPAGGNVPVYDAYCHEDPYPTDRLGAADCWSDDGVVYASIRWRAETHPGPFTIACHPSVVLSTRDEDPLRFAGHLGYLFATDTPAWDDLGEVT
jgi:hypothetical protein